MSKVIDALNAARSRELTAILQYMNFHYELEDKDFGRLAKTFKEIAIMEMKHAEQLAERILFLNGVPTYKLQAEVQKGLDIAGALKVSEALEQGAIDMYNESINLCAAEGDDGSKQILQHLLEQEEDHIDTFQNTLDHVEKLGSAYIATLA